MAKQTTRDAALSRLFGNPDVALEVQQSDKHERPKRPKKSTGATKKTVSKAPVSEPSRPLESDRGGEAKSGDSPSSYLGLGRYTRVDGVVERITPYVRPDQAEALRIAVARKNDPRGKDVSQIVQTLLDEAGYRG